MEVVITENSDEGARLVGETIEQLVRRRPEAVLGLATGSSPLAVYRELVRRVAAGSLSLRRARGFMLDEYVDLPADHPQRYRNVIAREFVTDVDIESRNVMGPDGNAADLPRACAAYESAIAAAGGVDLQLAGVGTDGHVAFNEPGSSLGSRTRVKTLTRRTRADNARFFEDDVDAVPQHCITQGIATILDARHVVVLAAGQAKADAVHELVEGPVAARWPVTALQLHPHVTVVVDGAAASRLELGDYYAETYLAKPAWQDL